MSARVPAPGSLRRLSTATIFLLLVAVLPMHAQQQQLAAEWNRNVTEYRGQNGRRVTLVCPPQGQVADVWGTDRYTDDSPVCPAAVHAGVIAADRGGVVTIAIEPGQSAYPASTRNGVPSKAFGQWGGSFSFVRSSGEGRVDWGTTARGLTTALGQSITLECPAGGTVGRVYGTDTYTDDSSICTAAVHAGLATRTDGGRVTIEATGEQAAFASSHRNGVTSQGYASWPNGFRFAGTSLGLASTSGGLMSAPPNADLPAPVSGAPIVSAPPTSTPAATTPPSNSLPTPTTPITDTPPPTTTPPPTMSPWAARTPPATTTPPTTSTLPKPSATSTTTGGSLANGALMQPAAGPKGVGTAVTVDGSSTAALGAPTGITVTPLGVGQVLVRWTPVPEASLYHIAYRKVGDAQWSTLTDRPGDQPATGGAYQSDPQLVLLPTGQLEFQMFAARNADDWTGTRSVAVRTIVPRYDGRYRLTLNGFRVNRETIDAPLNYDGQHDEIYVRAGVREYDADGNAIGSEQAPKTLTQGDVNAPRWRIPGTPTFRYPAGSATALGGLKSGDGFPKQSTPWVASSGPTTETFPLFVWEGYLREGGNTVAVMPVIYEDDESAWELMPELQALLDIGTWVGLRGYSTLQGIAATPRPVIQRRSAITPNVAGLKEFGARVSSMNVASTYGAAPANLVSLVLARQRQLTQTYGTLFKNVTAAASLLMNTKDRPIGMAGVEGGKVQFDPIIVRVSFESAEEFLANRQGNDPNIPVGIIPVRYVDTIPGGNGDYTLYLEIKRVP